MTRFKDVLVLSLLILWVVLVPSAWADEPERDALCALSQGLFLDGKPFWGKDICNAECVCCGINYPGIICSEGRVSQINIPDLGLRGRLSPHVTNLTELTNLNCSSNKLEGYIPSFSNLAKLIALVLSNNSFTGSIPSLENLPSLQEFNLTNNRLTGTIDMVFQDFLRLQIVDFSLNKLGGVLPRLDNLSSFQDLVVHHNSFVGNVPHPQNAPRLRILNLNTNGFSGPAPLYLSQDFPNLQIIRFDGNMLVGSLPNYTNFTNLTHIFLYNNSFTGEIPNYNNLPALLHLQLYGNDLHGTIPLFETLTSLATLYLGANNLTGTVPNFTMPLKELLVANCHLTGEIPPFRTLEWLDLSDNALNGTIPTIFANQTDLFRLMLGTNNLTGPLPAFKPHTKLLRLHVSGNSLSGPLPSDLGAVSTLISLYLSRNKFTGGIPNVQSLVHLTTLALGYNNMTGSIPNITGLGRLSVLYLDENSLEGSIPYMSNPRLHTVLIRGNNLTGDLPPFPPNIQVFDASDNNITGSLPRIPPSLANLNLAFNLLSSEASVGPEASGLRMINLNSNEFTKFSARSAPSLSMIHGERNQLTDVDIRDLTLLIYLDLSRNNLTQYPPLMYAPATSNLTLNLAYNRIAEPLPTEFLNPGLANLDLSFNRIPGEGDIEIRFLSDLVYGPNLCPPDGTYAVNYSEKCRCPPAPERRIINLVGNRMVAKTVAVTEVLKYQLRKIFVCHFDLEHPRTAAVSILPQNCQEKTDYFSKELKCIACASNWRNQPAINPEGWTTALQDLELPTEAILNISDRSYATCSSCSLGKRYQKRTIDSSAEECAGMSASQEETCDFPCLDGAANTTSLKTLINELKKPVAPGSPTFLNLIMASSLSTYKGASIIDINQDPDWFLPGKFDHYQFMRVSLKGCPDAVTFKSIQALVTTVASKVRSSAPPEKSEYVKVLPTPKDDYTSFVVQYQQIDIGMVIALTVGILALLLLVALAIHLRSKPTTTEPTMPLQGFPDDVTWHLKDYYENPH